MRLFSLAPHTSHLTPHTSLLTPHSSHLTPHSSHLTPHTSLLTPHTSHLTPHTSHLTPHTSHLTPRTSHLTPRTSHLTPHTSHLTPHTSHLTPHTSPLTPCSPRSAWTSAPRPSCSPRSSEPYGACAAPFINKTTRFPLRVLRRAGCAAHRNRCRCPRRNSAVRTRPTARVACAHRGGKRKCSSCGGKGGEGFGITFTAQLPNIQCAFELRATMRV